MNERIKELAEQAGLEWGPGGYADYGDFDHALFAQLVVAECVRRIEGCGVDPTQYEFDKEFVLGYNKGVSKVASQVKLHFGVE
jgi:hypothetical protein